jgi:hypothetical protein
MAETKNKDSCNSCRFFSFGDRMGICNRYPQSINKANQDWCGEFLAFKNLVFEAMSYTINVDNIKPEEPKKQRGRPKKS